MLTSLAPETILFPTHLDLNSRHASLCSFSHPSFHNKHHMIHQLWPVKKLWKKSLPLRHAQALHERHPCHNPPHQQHAYPQNDDTLRQQRDEQRAERRSARRTARKQERDQMKRDQHLRALRKKRGRQRRRKERRYEKPPNTEKRWFQ